MLSRIAHEMKRHAPFTFAGALSGIAIMLVIVHGNFLPLVIPVSERVFYILHPAHVLLSAMVTTALYMKYGKGKVWLAILIGYSGAIGIATISDSLIPYLGESLLALPNRGIHIGFIEKWWLVNPAALLGIALGYWRGATRLPHYGHVLISTWASMFHVVMALGTTLSWFQSIAITGFLFLAVWVPCCASDIIYPLLFARGQPLPEKATPGL